MLRYERLTRIAAAEAGLYVYARRRQDCLNPCLGRIPANTLDGRPQSPSGLRVQIHTERNGYPISKEPEYLQLDVPAQVSEGERQNARLIYRGNSWAVLIIGTKSRVKGAILPRCTDHGDLPEVEVVRVRLALPIGRSSVPGN